MPNEIDHDFRDRSDYEEMEKRDREFALQLSLERARKITGCQHSAVLPMEPGTKICPDCGIHVTLIHEPGYTVTIAGFPGSNTFEWSKLPAPESNVSTVVASDATE
jgi:hypothetical protein